MRQEMELVPWLQEALYRCDVKEYSDIQKKVIPAAMAGKDILAIAPTGSGKTYAYLIPVLQKLEPQTGRKKLPEALILVPTRELAIQTAGVIRHLLERKEGIRTAVLTGGVDMQVQIRSFSKGADIVVGTPARIRDHLRRHTLKTAMCSTLILDEADELLSLGFREDTDSIIAQLPAHQTMLFSATWPQEMQVFADAVLQDPLTIKMEKEEVRTQHIRHTLVRMTEQDKPAFALDLCRKEKKQIIIFCNTRRKTDEITTFLQKHGILADAVHSDMDMPDRRRIMAAFRARKQKVLCATEAAGRGVDIPAVDCVLSLDVPDRAEILVHRFGRTSRDGSQGHAYLAVSPQDERKLKAIGCPFDDLEVQTYKQSRRRK